jgi:hypothetical protein
MTRVARSWKTQGDVDVVEEAWIGRCCDLMVS